MNKLFLLGAIPLVLLLVVPHNALAWDFGNGPWLGGFHHCGLYTYGQPGAYQNGYYAGQQDAIYDHDNGHQYNPVGQCLPCHSQAYWHNFRQGYDQQWNTYQSQEHQTDQHTNIYVNGNNNYINTAQSSNQGQGQSQEQGPNWFLQNPQCEQCLGSDITNDDWDNGCPWGQGP